MRILIVGGYGTFGGRLVDLLQDRRDLTLIVGGRDAAAAGTFCASRQNAKARVLPLQMDRTRPHAVLKQQQPDLVVDASGPFQVYGAQPYVLARACMAQRCNYVDLADGAAFVEGIAALDGEAKAAGVFVLSGMSSFPVLTAAVSRELAKDLDQVESITSGIAPSPYAGVGLNVIKAIASYSGKPVDVLLNRQWVKRAGFFDSRRLLVAVPGEVPLPPIRFALTDVPDLKVLKWQHPEAHSIWMGAGPTPALLHRLLWACAGLVKLRLLPSLLPFAQLMNIVVNTVRWGEHRGGFVLEMTGTKNGMEQKLSWHLLAEGEGGPMIPSMAVAAVIDCMKAGKMPAAGARSGHGDLQLDNYQFWFDRYGIKTGRRVTPQPDATLYQNILGEAFGGLSAPQQRLHSARGDVRMSGEARVTGGAGVLARLVRKIFGFPPPRGVTLVDVHIAKTGQREVWDRRYAGKLMRSVQTAGGGRNVGLLVESFGPLSFAMAVVVRDQQLNLVPRRWTAFGVPMPKLLMPRVTAREHGGNDRHNFHVEIHLPGVGYLVGYEGWVA